MCKKSLKNMFYILSIYFLLIFITPFVLSETDNEKNQINVPWKDAYVCVYKDFSMSNCGKYDNDRYGCIMTAGHIACRWETCTTCKYPLSEGKCVEFPKTQCDKWLDKNGRGRVKSAVYLSVKEGSEGIVGEKLKSSNPRSVTVNAYGFYKPSQGFSIAQQLVSSIISNNPCVTYIEGNDEGYSMMEGVTASKQETFMGMTKIKDLSNNHIKDFISSTQALLKANEKNIYVYYRYKDKKDGKISYNVKCIENFVDRLDVCKKDFSTCKDEEVKTAVDCVDEIRMDTGNPCGFDTWFDYNDVSDGAKRVSWTGHDSSVTIPRIGIPLEAKHDAGYGQVVVDACMQYFFGKQPRSYPRDVSVEVSTKDYSIMNAILCSDLIGKPCVSDTISSKGALPSYFLRLCSRFPGQTILTEFIVQNILFDTTGMYQCLENSNGKDASSLVFKNIYCAGYFDSVWKYITE